MFSRRCCRGAGEPASGVMLQICNILMFIGGFATCGLSWIALLLVWVQNLEIDAESSKPIPTSRTGGGFFV